MFTRQLTRTINIPKKIEDFLVSIKPYKGGDWDRYDEEIKILKKTIKDQLTCLQDGKCAYCGLELATRAPEIEHIAPKGGKIRPKHVEFVFLPLNLVMACRRCNNPTHKGQKDTIATKSLNYSDCEFTIVHPYLDDPNDFFEFVESLGVVDGIIQMPKCTSTDAKKNKARFTIKMFGLDTEEVILARAEQLCYRNRCFQLTDKSNKLIKDVVSYIPNNV